MVLVHRLMIVVVDGHLKNLLIQLDNSLHLFLNQ